MSLVCKKDLDITSKFYKKYQAFTGSTSLLQSYEEQARANSILDKQTPLFSDLSDEALAKSEVWCAYKESNLKPSDP
jgi:hypothetical protein